MLATGIQASHEKTAPHPQILNWIYIDLRDYQLLEKNKIKKKKKIPLNNQNNPHKQNQGKLGGKLGGNKLQKTWETNFNLEIIRPVF